MMTASEPFNRFKALHHQGAAFVMPNLWDARSARILASMGFAALGATSAGHAFSIGKWESFAALSRDDNFGTAQAIVAATDLPVSANLEDGVGAGPETCAQTMGMACDICQAGGALEDATGDRDSPICDLGAATDRVRAAG
jgi:2-methylisocitrate lyase-like PEP mutase family enzyme